MEIIIVQLYFSLTSDLDIQSFASLFKGCGVHGAKPLVRGLGGEAHPTLHSAKNTFVRCRPVRSHTVSVFQEHQKENQYKGNKTKQNGILHKGFGNINADHRA